jgi:VanZ family protein
MRLSLSARLCLLVIALTISVSLVPFQGWRMVEVSWVDFFLAPPPRVLPPVDVLINILAYVPVGALLLLSVRRHLAPVAALSASVLGAGALSLGLECVQHFLPSRVPSNIDVLANLVGAMLGVAAAWRWGSLLAPGGRLAGAWMRWRDEDLAHDAGLALLALWWLAQWSPHTPLFGIGGLRQMLEIDAPGNFSVDRFVVFESLAVGVGVLAGGLVAAALFRRGRRRIALAALLVGMAVKTLGFTLLARNDDLFAWLSPGALRGLIVGGVVLLIAAHLRPGLRRALAALALLLAVALNNLIPDNPYLVPGVPAFPAAQWLNVDGLSRLAAVFWPFFALSWLMSARRPR